uniref:WW domain-containing protein n=1 Tax=Alexandrium monilatum TaxID=311494 RepID=A0A7S4V0E5_9DINO
MVQAVELQTFDFHYKHRSHKGYAVHILALYPRGEAMLARLIEMKVDVNKACESRSRGRITYACPLHIAAGGGQQMAVSLLLDAEVDIDQKSWVEDLQGEEEAIKPGVLWAAKKLVGAKKTPPGDKKGSISLANANPPAGAANAEGPMSASPNVVCKEHYTALLEATFFQQEQMVRFLLEQRADPDITNKEDETALHWAARQGNASIAELLVTSRADVKKKGKAGKTALEIAVENAKFPGNRLSMLMTRQMSEIMTVAERAPNAAKELLCNVHADDQWRPQLLNHVKWDQWVELMEMAPQVAEDVLEAVTITPEVENNDHYPLPKQAIFSEREMIRCTYTKDDKWSYNAQEGEAQSWHQTLIPKESIQGSDKPGDWHRALRSTQRNFGIQRKLVPIRVKIVRIPGLINAQVLRALSDTDYLDIFRNLAAQAILECVWNTVVQKFYYVHMLYRTIELGLLVTWVFAHDEGQLFRRITWSWLFACSSRELFYELCEIRGYVRMRGYFVSAYLMDLKNIFDLTSIGMLIFLAIQTWPHQQLEANLPLLAAVVTSRWVQLVYTFRAFPTVGQKVLPIIQSFRPLGGILFITVFIFVGFLHAFLVLNKEPQTEQDFWEVFVAAIRFLFIADGDAVDTILGLGGRDSATGDYVTRFFFISAVIGFSILILNLFIAGAHQAYEEAHQNAETRFFQERADICLQCLFRPTLPCKQRVLGFCLIVGLLMPSWLALLVYLPEYPVCAAALLFASAILGDSVLLRHNWNKRIKAEGGRGNLRRVQEAGPAEFAERDNSNSDVAEDTDPPSTLASTFSDWEPRCTESEQMYLWFCYRVECEDPGDGSGGENGKGSTLMGRKAYEKMNRQTLEMRKLRRDTEKMHQAMESKLSQIQRQLSLEPLDLGDRLHRLEQHVLRLAAHMDRIGLSEQHEAQLPEGWSMAQAPNGRPYYYNRALRIRQWEKPTGPPATLPRTGTPRSLPSHRPALPIHTRSISSSLSGNVGIRHVPNDSVASAASVRPGGGGPTCEPIAESPGDAPASARAAMRRASRGSGGTLAPGLPSAASQADVGGSEGPLGGASSNAGAPAAASLANGRRASRGSSQAQLPDPGLGTAEEAPRVPGAAEAPPAEKGASRRRRSSPPPRRKPRPLDLT